MTRDELPGPYLGGGSGGEGGGRSGEGPGSEPDILWRPAVYRPPGDGRPTGKDETRFRTADPDVGPAPPAIGTLAARLSDRLEEYPDFPEPGVLFRDIVPVLRDVGLYGEILDRLGERVRASGAQAVAGIESRGFLLAAPVARDLGLPFVLVRKEGKLPGRTVTARYGLEYGTAELELQEASVPRGEAVYVLDDVLATGGTMQAAAHLVGKAGGIVAGLGVLVELSELGGRKKLDSYNLFSILTL